MVKFFTRQQEAMLMSARARLQIASINDTADILVLTAPPGAGMSVCVSALCRELNRSAVILSNQLAEYSCQPTEWLSDYFGLFEAKSLPRKMSAPLRTIATLVSLRLVVVEDVHDWQRYRAKYLERIFDDFRILRSSIYELKIILTINGAYLPWLRTSLADMEVCMCEVPLEYMCDDCEFKNFVDHYMCSSSRAVRNMLEDPLATKLLFKASNGAVGRLVMMLDYLNFNSKGKGKKELLCILQRIADLLCMRKM